ncbi:uncharacterized protein LOC143260628 [Megalopta genalis]|uniref:uncharacterized protein LOC143260628 n=1 Tax=Megalopta genalis TaxID=115081 RepID=UPI003FCF72E6
MEAAKAFFTERGSVKARLTIFKRFLESESANADLMALEKRVRANESLYELFNNVQTRIECAVIGTPYEEAQIAERESFENDYYSIMSKAETLLLKARENSVTATNSDLEIGLSRLGEVEEVVNAEVGNAEVGNAEVGNAEVGDAEVGNAEVNGKDHDPCEQHFVENTRRDEQGRSIVAIPFNDRTHELGESRPQAERGLLDLERKFRKQPDLQAQYKEFLREYENLGHMSRLDPKDIGGVSGSYYLPHHAVMEGNSTTTKLRVVFDGSAKTASGVPLNDTQMVGPPTQDELLDILLRFRKHGIVVSADVAKMYRQIAVRGEDRSYQGILWRFSEHDVIGRYSLNTITYGTAFASYLATRVLQQIGKYCAHSLPDVSEVIRSDFYVDDLLTCETCEQALVKLTTSVRPVHPVLKLIEGQSCYSKLLRILAYVLRFCSKSQRTDKASRSKCQGSPSITELSSAERIVIRVTQNHHFSVEMRQLGARQPLDRTSSLLSLNPFVDELGIIRVGGRLRNAPIAFSRKHPILIPSSSPLAVLIIRREHLRLLHAGCQQTLASLHANYWIPSGGRITRKVVRSCMRCFRTKPGAAQPQMGNLPADRVTPFSTCGVDYAGPFLVVDSGRSRTSRKAYLCLFVCFVTKAVHLELAVDLTTDSFLNGLRRFTARRGMCRVIHSDNGTNFIGARNELRDLGHFLASPAHNDKVKGALAQNKIQWQLIPPRAPHFGGLWERAVRSVKTHLRRVRGEQRLTFEEMCTVLTQVEACLNSRPFHPLSSDPSDLNPLSPGHFLVGEALTALPHVHLLDTPRNRLNRFQLLQQMVQHFWKRWHEEYLHGLQQRRKWRQGCAVVPKVGDMVLIKEDNLPPLKWALGRVVELHPGQDGICRVSTIRTTRGMLKRPASKICVLPIED